MEGPTRMHGMGRNCILFLSSLFIDLFTVDGNSVEYWLQTEILVLSTCACADRILTLGWQTEKVIWLNQPHTVGTWRKASKSRRFGNFNFYDVFNIQGTDILVSKKSTCSNHKAHNAAGSLTKDLDATGGATCACGRHGCYVPHSFVDFQKGERWAFIEINHFII